MVSPCARHDLPDSMNLHNFQDRIDADSFLILVLDFLFGVGVWCVCVVWTKYVLEHIKYYCFDRNLKKKTKDNKRKTNIWQLEYVGLFVFQVPFTFNGNTIVDDGQFAIATAIDGCTVRAGR